MSILVAVGEKGNPDRIIETGQELAAAFDDELQVLHVIPEEEAEEHFEALRSIEEFSDISFVTEIDRAAEIAETLTKSVLGESLDDGVTPVGRVGDPAHEILAATESIDPRYLVIGGRKRSPAGKAIFGSVTQSVVLNSAVPTVTVIADE